MGDPPKLSGEVLLENVLAEVGRVEEEPRARSMWLACGGHMGLQEAALGVDVANGDAELLFLDTGEQHLRHVGRRRMLGVPGDERGRVPSGHRRR